MELRRYAHLLRRRILLLALAVVAGLAGGYLAANRTPRYQAQASIYIGSRQFAAIAESTNASAAMDRLTQTFAAMIRSEAVATAAIHVANAPRSPAEVVAATGAAVVANTNYISISVTDTDPGMAQALANGEAKSFVALVEGLEPGTAAGPGTPAVTSVFQQAGRPTAPLSTSTKRDLVLGGLAGLAGGVALVALLNYLDVTIKNPDELERAGRLPVLGTIPVLKTLPAPATAPTARSVAG